MELQSWFMRGGRPYLFIFYGYRSAAARPNTFDRNPPEESSAISARFRPASGCTAAGAEFYLWEGVVSALQFTAEL